jgi:nitrite reductase/ring-hydroxylating ferredoxin subunit
LGEQVRLARVDDVPDNGMTMREHGGRSILLVRIDGAVFALDDECPHEGAPLHEGQLGIQGPCQLTCPWHEAHFDVRTGCADPETPWASDLKRFPVEIRDGEIWVTF